MTDDRPYKGYDKYVMFRNYLNVILRNLLRYRGYSAINVLGLAIGLASCILILLYVQDELSYDQHHERKDRIYRIVVTTTAEGRTDEWARTPSAWAPVLKEEYPEIEQFTRWKPPNTSWLIGYNEKRYEEKFFIFADSSVFDIFTIPLVQGNPRTALAEPHTVVVSETMAELIFGNENPVGKVVSVDDTYMFTVTGIMRDMPTSSHFHADFLASFSTLAASGIYNEPTTIQNMDRTLYTYLPIKEGYAPEDLEVKLRQFPERYLGERLETLGMEFKPYLQPLTDIHLHSNLKLELKANSDIRYVYIFTSLAVFILLIACVNFMNLSTARSARRAREVGIRKVLGARRVQLTGQFIGESVLFSFIALAVALVLVHLILPEFSRFSGKELEMDYESTWLMPVLLAITLCTGIVAGGYPAFVLSSFRPVAVLSGVLKAGVSQSFLRKALITFQFVASIIMIVGTVVILAQLEYMRNKKLGFDKEHVVVVRLPDNEAVQGYPAFKDKVLQYPEIVNLSTTTSVPGRLTATSFIQPDGYIVEDTPLISTIWTGFDFVETMGIKIVSGRSFSRSVASDDYSVLVNETAVSTFGWEDPIGKVFTYTHTPDYPPMHVVGVMADFHYHSLHQRIEPLLILFWEGGNTMVVRLSSQSLARGLEILQDQWRESYPNHPVMESYFLDQDLDQKYAAEQRLGSVFIAGTVLSILIACLGLLGLASYMAEQRTREIGVRKVLGATISNVILLLPKDFTRLILIAFVVGVPISYYIMQEWLEDFPYRIEMGLWVFILTGLAAMLITWLTVGYHALKAATANPADALRSE